MMLLVKIGISIMCVAVLAMIGALVLSCVDSGKWSDVSDMIVKVAAFVMIGIAGMFILWLLAGIWTGEVVLEGSFL